MRFVFYKLPRESGENIIITSTYVFADSDLALLMDEDDLDKDFYDFQKEGDEIHVAKVEEASEDIDPYFIVDAQTLNVEGTLPFRSEESATRFIDALVRWQKYLNEEYDA